MHGCLAATVDICFLSAFTVRNIIKFGQVGQYFIGARNKCCSLRLVSLVWWPSEAAVHSWISLITLHTHATWSVSGKGNNNNCPALLGYCPCQAIPAVPTSSHWRGHYTQPAGWGCRWVEERIDNVYIKCTWRVHEGQVELSGLGRKYKWITRRISQVKRQTNKLGRLRDVIKS